ncbi:hypothetical protein BHE74_00029866, partial [Ensete ventricosum]
ALTLLFTLLGCRRCPCAIGGAARCGRQPRCQGAADPTVDAAAPAGSSPLRVRRGQPLVGWPLAAVPCGHPTGSRPLRAVAPAGGRPLQGGPWLQPAAPTGGDWPWLSAPLQPATTSPSSLYLLQTHPDGEDEGGQASSSLAVSTRWISAAKLLQSNLATLTQREGGEYEVVAKVAAYQP